MSASTCLYNGTIFDGEAIIAPGSVLFDENGMIAVTGDSGPVPADRTIDAGGRLVIPGLVDLHSDALEKCIEMRPGILFDAEFALMGLDRRLASCGITTICHAICFADNELGLRESHEAAELVGKIRRFNQGRHATVRHLIHGRYEIGAEIGAKFLEALIAERQLDLLSIMDHTPGQGQFKTMQSFIQYYGGAYQITLDEIRELVDRKKRLQADGWSLVSHLAAAARNGGIPLLSHDDDTRQKVDLVRGLGASASEFPVSMDAVAAGKAHGFKVFMGAPNLLRGESSSGHLKAADTVSAGCCDGLMSDYYPECLIQTPFAAQRRLGIELAQTLKLVTSQPGSYLDPQTRAGRLAPGLPADLVVVDADGDWVQVLQTWVGGRCVYQTKGLGELVD